MEEENQENKPSQDQIPDSAPPLPRSYANQAGMNLDQRMIRSWPHLAGLSAEEAEKKIKEEMPEAFVQVVQPDCFVTMDFNTNRVRLYVDSTGKVEREPRVG